MAESQKVKQKADKRAAALRDNLKKRKAFIKEARLDDKKQEDTNDAKSENR